MYKYFILCFTILSALLFTGCGQEPTIQSKKHKSISTDKISISNSSIFNEKTKLLAPHLGLITGAVKIEYPNQLDQLYTIYYWTEIWQNGKKQTKKSKSACTSIKPFPAILSISLKNVSRNTQSPEYKVTLAIKGSSGFVFTKHTRPLPPTSKTRSSVPKTLSKTVEINKGEELAVWAYLMGCNYIDGNESIEKAATKAERAIVLKIRIEVGTSNIGKLAKKDIKHAKTLN